MIKVGSFRQGITWLMLSSSVAFATFALLVLSLLHLNHVNKINEAYAYAISQVVSDATSRFLLFDDAEGLTNSLQYFRGIPELLHIHVYQRSDISAEQQLRYFASFNREGLAPIPVRIELITSFSGARSQANYIEVAQPVMIDNEQLGYIYLRTSREHSTYAVWLTALASSVLVVFTGICVWLISLRARSKLMAPLDTTVDIIQRVSRNRDYSIRLPESRLLELQQLAISFNTMLARVEQHLERQHQAERNANELNVELERQVQQRTTALRESNAELIETLEKLHQFQRQMIENEKMQSLGDLIAGVAHEINTPVGLVITSTSILQDKLELMQQKFQENTITRKDFERFMEASEDNLSLIRRNIERTADLINQFRQLAMDQFAEETREINMRAFCLALLRSASKRYPMLTEMEVNLDCPPELLVTTRIGPLRHIFKQLLENSMLHGFAERDHGCIDVHIERLSGKQVKIRYRDNGSGIPDSLKRRIFDPFVTSRRRQGSTGLGLHLVYNLVTRALHGTIEVDSQPGQFTEFSMTIEA